MFISQIVGLRWLCSSSDKHCKPPCHARVFVRNSPPPPPPFSNSFYISHQSPPHRTNGRKKQKPTKHNGEWAKRGESEEQLTHVSVPSPRDDCRSSGVVSQCADWLDLRLGLPYKSESEERSSRDSHEMWRAGSYGYLEYVLMLGTVSVIRAIGLLSTITGPYLLSIISWIRQDDWLVECAIRFDHSSLIM